MPRPTERDRQRNTVNPRSLQSEVMWTIALRRHNWVWENTTLSHQCQSHHSREIFNLLSMWLPTHNAQYRSADVRGRSEIQISNVNHYTTQVCLMIITNTSIKTRKYECNKSLKSKQIPSRSFMFNTRSVGAHLQAFVWNIIKLMGIIIYSASNTFLCLSPQPR